ncbi:SH3 domain-containing protein [Globomyces pollinis-pini]|nr:SH3 domain-containing protein [Globomyces pollinis-pini]
MKLSIEDQEFKNHLLNSIDHELNELKSHGWLSHSTFNQLLHALESERNPIQKHSSNNLQKCIALYDFNPETNDDLLLKQGDEVLILQDVDDDWYRGRVGAREGLFPKTYVELK